MNRIIIAFLLSLSFSTNEIKSQNIYGFSENIFGSTNIQDGTIDTLIVFPGNPWINNGFRSAIDRFNGRYFFGGSLPGYNGNFHIIDLFDLTIDSHSIFPENIEYDFIQNRLIYERGGSFYSLDLITSQLTNLGIIENGNSGIYGQKRAYNPQANKYFYTDYINGSVGDPYFLLIDGDSGEIDCQSVIEEVNGVFYVPGAIVCNNLTGDLIGIRGGKYGIIDPCNGTITELSGISDFNAHLNNQMAVYNHNDNTYIIPYYSSDSNDKYKIAIIDVYNDEIIRTVSQPWNGKMNLQQIYDQPIAPLVYLKDTLFVPTGQNYKWFLDEEVIGETSSNYWVPVESGIYKAQVEFKEYTTYSTEQQIVFTTTKESILSSTVKISPNPTSDLTNLIFPYSESIKVQLIKLSGEILYSNNLKNSSSAIIDMYRFPKGLYIVKVISKDFNISELLTKS